MVSWAVSETFILNEMRAMEGAGVPLVAYSLKDGKELWSADAALNYQASPDVFYLDGKNDKCRSNLIHSKVIIALF